MTASTSIVKLQVETVWAALSSRMVVALCLTVKPPPDGSFVTKSSVHVHCEVLRLMKILSNVQNCKLLRAKARHVVKQQKRNSWRHFCNKLNSKTQTQKVWKAIRKIQGKSGCNSINHLKMNSNLITDKKEVVEVLAKNLSKISSTDNNSDEFIIIIIIDRFYIALLSALEQTHCARM